MFKSLKDSFYYFKKLHPKESVARQEYLKICADFMLFMIDKVLKGHVVRIPSRLGLLYIKGVKQKIKIIDNKIVGAAPDWSATKKLRAKNPQANAERRMVYYTNNHTDGYRYRFFWSKKNVYVEFKTLYSLRMTKKNKSLASKMILKGVEYITKEEHYA